MRYKQLTALMQETGLSPEKLAVRLRVSNLTYRRWLKRRPDDEIPEAYERNIAGGIYELLAEGKLDHDSKSVGRFLEGHLPEFFQAVTGRLNVASEILDGKAPHQEKITAALSHIGNNATVQKRVDAKKSDIKEFSTWGADWKKRVTLLAQVVFSRQLSAVDKLVAYGALFYLILPIDFIPDSIPVFGYVDDFGILGFAAAHYMKVYPALFPSNV